MRHRPAVVLIGFLAAPPAPAEDQSAGYPANPNVTSTAIYIAHSGVRRYERKHLRLV